MTEKEKLKKEYKYVKDFISYLEKGYGKEICTWKKKQDFHPSCVNCQSQWTLGWLREHLSLIEWELDFKDKKKKEIGGLKSTRSQQS